MTGLTRLRQLGTRIAIRLQRDGALRALRDLVLGLVPHPWWIYSRRACPCSAAPGPDIETSLAELSRMRLRQQNLPAEFYRDEAKRSERCVFACRDGRLAGIVWLFDRCCPNHRIRLGPGETEVACLYVVPEFRGQGIGKALVLKACEVAFREGPITVHAVVSKRNTASIALFESCGFERKGSAFRSALIGRRYRAGTPG